MKAGRRFRAELTEAQARLAQQTADACRAVYNTGLEQRREYRRRGAWMNYEEQAHELVEAKKEHTWLTEAPSHCLQQALRDLDDACRKHGTFKVRWRSARRWVPSFRFPEGSQMGLEKLNRRKSRVKLPKLGWVKFRASRRLDGETIRSATLSREGTHWFVSLLQSASRYSGTQVVKVPAAFTSQRCSACGHVDPKSRESQAVFRCTHCSRPAEHADVNAAKNILAAGLLAVSACGDDP